MREDRSALETLMVNLQQEDFCEQEDNIGMDLKEKLDLFSSGALVNVVLNPSVHMPWS